MVLTDHICSIILYSAAAKTAPMPPTVTRDVDGRLGLQVCSSDVAVQRHGPVAAAVLPHALRAGQVLHAVSEDVGMGTAPLQGAELHHGNEPTKVVDLCPLVLSMDHA